MPAKDAKRAVDSVRPRRAPAASGIALLAHGAGGQKDHPHLLALASLLDAAGLQPIRFNFPYRDQGRGFPDPMPVLLERFRAQAEKFQAAKVPEKVRGNVPGRAGEKRPGLLVLSGHSLGARAASMLAAGGYPCDGLILFSYPLHAPGKPEKLRDAHLSDVGVPVLSISGTRDAFCTPELMDKVVGKLRHWTHIWLREADHAWAVAKKSGRTREDALAEAAGAIGKWLRALR